MPTNVTLTNYIWMDKHVAAFADSQEVQYTENFGERSVRQYHGL
jgi:hypothetical protein